jgi:hypothetical protein
VRRTLVALTILLAAGCTAPRSDAAPPGPPAERLMLAALDRGDVPLAEAFAYHHDRNARIVQCMKPTSYAYLPFVSRAAIDSRRALGLSRQAFTERYGYGTTTLIDYVPAGTVVVDPNEIALSRLSPVERETTGKQLTACTRTVDAAIGPAPYAAQQELDATQAARSDRILARVDADPRMVAAQRTRTACIRAAGYDPGDARTLPYADAAAEARDAYEKAARDLAAAGRDSDRLRLRDVLPPDRLAALAAVQRREIAEARRVQPCQYAYDDAYLLVYRETLNAALAGAF